MKKTEDTYYLLHEYKNEKCHAKVYCPILTEEEWERRMKKLKKSTEAFFVEYYTTLAKNEREKERSKQHV
jgi:hypothetical protein